MARMPGPNLQSAGIDPGEAQAIRHAYPVRPARAGPRAVSGSDARALVRGAAHRAGVGDRWVRRGQKAFVPVEALIF